VATTRDPLTGEIIGGDPAIRPQPVGGSRVIDGEFEVVPPRNTLPSVLETTDPTRLPSTSVLDEFMPPPPGGRGPIAIPLAAAGVAGGFSMLGDDEEEAPTSPLKDASDVLKQQAADQKGVSVREVEEEAEDEIRKELDDPSFIDAFASEFDLTTLGLALLASNDGKSSLGVNLGKAMQAAREAVISKKKLARDEGREDRKEKRAERGLDIEQQKGDIAALSEQRKAVLAAAAANGVKLSIPSASARDNVAALVEGFHGEEGLFKHKGRNANSTHVGALNEAARALELAEKVAQAQGRVLSESERMQIVVSSTSRYIKPDSFLGFPAPGKKVVNPNEQQQTGGTTTINGVPVTKVR
jgi:hypothetical protein